MRKWIAGAGLAVFVATTVHAATPNPVGRWRTQMHGALVDVRMCADQVPCAFLAWVDPAKAGGVTKDLQNPDPSLRSRPLVGVPILWGLRPSGNGWKGGRVYNPETGQIFRSSMQPLSADKLRVTGCWGPLCRSEIWTRAN
jgi:uncharacterized protein (DUF2147 family)